MPWGCIWGSQGGCEGILVAQGGALGDRVALRVPRRWISGWGYLAQCPVLSLLQLPLPLSIPQRCLQLPNTALGTAESHTQSWHL